MSKRETVVVHGSLGRAHIRADAARSGRNGLQIHSFESLACRLAGGFSAPIDDDALRDAVQKALPEIELGELDAIKGLPGMVTAAAGTLRKAWRSGLDIQEEASRHPRVASVARLEQEVMRRLPPSAMRPADIAAKAMDRIAFAETLFGSIRIDGVTELSPCWRPLLHALAKRVRVDWDAGPRNVPGWLDEIGRDRSLGARDAGRRMRQCGKRATRSDRGDPMGAASHRFQRRPAGRNRHRGRDPGRLRRRFP